MTVTALTQLATVFVPVEDQDEAITFYRDVLGFEQRVDVTYGTHRWVEVAPAGSTFALALVSLSEGRVTDRTVTRAPSSAPTSTPTGLRSGPRARPAGSGLSSVIAAGHPARKGSTMGNPVVHFEIIGTDPQLLRGYYGELFGWEFDTSGPVSPAVSEAGNYGFTDNNTTSDGVGIPGGVGGGANYDGHAVFYVGVPDVEAALQKAESLGGTRRVGPEQNPGTDLVVGQFTDPEGHLIGLASIT